MIAHFADCVELFMRVYIVTINALPVDKTDQLPDGNSVFIKFSRKRKWSCAYCLPPEDAHWVARWVGRPGRETEASRAHEAVTVLTHDAFRPGFCYSL